MSNQLQVLVVEDNPGDVVLIREALPETGPVSFAVESVPRLSDALARLKHGGLDLMIIDLGLPDSQGLNTFNWLRDAAPQIAMIVLSGNDDLELALAAVREGAQDYLVKGQVGGDALVRAARYAVERNRMEEQVRALNAELEQRVHERTAQFEAANKELEAFSYSVSHDLRAPLRAIEGFSGMVLEDYGGKLDAEGQRLLGVVRANAVKMSRLIDDLLSLSRIGRGELILARLEMGLLARSVFAEIVPDPEARAKIGFMVGELPDAAGDAALVRQVWVNLLSNAVKFSSRKERTVIEVTGVREGNQVVYCVRDNGAGFDMQYAGRLFGVFQRLHTTEEFVGTGIGLALVQRIVLRHGGRVRAEAEVGKGAAFFFSLPAGATEHRSS